MKTNAIIPANLAAALALGLALGPLTAQAGELRLPPLNAPPTRTVLPGKFIWGDLVTDNVAAAQAFYGKLFGWTFQTLGTDSSTYTIALNGARPLGGLLQAPIREGKPHQPRWVGYISVPNVKRASRAAVKAGGKQLTAPRAFPERGRQALLTDAEGAVFGVMQSSSGDPEDFLPEPGDWIWIQLLCRDTRQAAEFYRAVAGYEVVGNSETKFEHDFVLVGGKYARASIMAIPPERENIRPNWLPFARVLSVSDSVAQAKQLGGKVLVEPKPELLDGKVAVVADPTGAAVGLLEWEKTSTVEAK